MESFVNCAILVPVISSSVIINPILNHWFNTIFLYMAVVATRLKSLFSSYKKKLSSLLVRKRRDKANDLFTKHQTFSVYEHSENYSNDFLFLKTIPYILWDQLMSCFSNPLQKQSWKTVSYVQDLYSCIIPSKQLGYYRQTRRVSRWKNYII